MGYIGLNWFKCDFHLHTMTSRCYRENNTVDEWIEAVKNKNLDCIAITDHNDYRGIDEIKKKCEEEGIVAFPGVELSCDSTKIHILIIFDINCTAENVQEFLNNVGIFSSSLGDSASTCRGEITEVCEKAQKMGALVIAAHIDDFNGINQMSHANIEKILDRRYLNAVQVVNSDIWEQSDELTIEEVAHLLSMKYGKEISVDSAKAWKKAYNMALKTDLPLLSFSDNPSTEGETTHGLWGIGKNYTWLKMASKPNLESVRQALLSYDMRLKTDFQSKKKPDTPPELFITQIVMKNTLLNENEIVIDFNPQLNTIIGGRGSGKSAIIRTIAGALKSFDAERLETIKAEQENFYRANGKIKGSSVKRGIFNSNSEIDIYMERLDDMYMIRVNAIKEMEDQKRALYRKENGTWEPVQEEDFLNFFKAQIFTQKQIYELAMDSNSLLSIIDDDIVGLSQCVSDRDSALNNIISKSLEINDLEISIKEESKVQTEIKDIEIQISKYEKSGISEALKEKQKYELQSKIIEDFISSKNEQNQKINTLVSEIRESKMEIQQTGNEELDAIIAEDFQAWEKQIEDIDLISKVLQQESEKFKEKVAASQWNKSLKEADESYKNVCHNLEEQGIDFTKLDELLEKKKAKIKELDKINADKTKLNIAKAEYKSLYGAYEHEIEKVFIARRDFIDSVIGNDSNVKFEVVKNRNRTSFISIMKNIMQKDITTIDDDISEMAELFFSKNGVDKFRKQMNDIRSKIDVKLYSAKTRSIITEMQPEAFARLIAFLPEDDLKVSYKPEKSNKFIPLSNASAGQKTTAILTFLLAYGTLPLLLDQPEDDLDNKLVYDLVVTRLKKAKSKRQIIVVTHNANIPVNGDAEYIVSMNSETDRIRTKYKGTMDDINIRKEICDVMEGTKDAFEMRAKKYHFKIIE